MLEKFHKKEKLKRSKHIETLFSEGKFVYSYPIKLLYLQTEFDDGAKLKIGFAASKKNFKHAVDRNLLKRRMREAYRKNKPTELIKNYMCMVIYTSKKKEDYRLIEKKINQCLIKIIEEELLPIT